MGSKTTTTVAKAPSPSPYQLDPSQTLRASGALLRKIQTDQTTRRTDAAKPSLLADADDDEAEAEDEVPVWLILTTKKHITDKKRLKPGKIALPHPYRGTTDGNLRVCLIAADPQRKYKDIIAQAGLEGKVRRVVGLEKLKSKYKSYEARRQLLGEYDVFLADDRVITYLPQVLGKVFYKSSSKRPIPVSLEGKRQSVDEHGNKRRKLSEGGTKVTKTEVTSAEVAKEIERTLASALVHLAPSTTTAVKVGTESLEPQQLRDNVEAVVNAMVEKYVPQQWRNVRSIHIKGPETVALPIWLAEELWTDEQDVLDAPPPPKSSEKKRKRGALVQATGEAEQDEPNMLEFPGPDGKMRRVENPAKSRKSRGVDAVVSADGAVISKPAKSREAETGDAAAAKEAEKAAKEARKAALKKQKEEAKREANAGAATVNGGGKKVARKTKSKAAERV